MRRKIISMFLLMMLVVAVFCGCTEKRQEEEIAQYVAEQWERDKPFLIVSWNYSFTIEDYVDNATFHLDVAEFLLNVGDYMNASNELILADENYSNAFIWLQKSIYWFDSIENNANASADLLDKLHNGLSDSSGIVTKVKRRLHHHIEIIYILARYQQLYINDSLYRNG